MANNITTRSRNLRKHQTKAESILWQSLRRKALGYRFRRQQPLRLKIQGLTKIFIVDFYCSEHKLAIEVDGKVHENQVEYDTARERLISVLGIRILRLKNDDIEFRLPKTLLKIQSALNGKTLANEAPLSPDLGKGAGG